MSTRLFRLTSRGFFLGALIFTAAGLLIISTNYLSAHSPDEEDEEHVNDSDVPTLSLEDLKPAEPYPRPDESSSMRLESAEVALREDSELDATVSAIREMDVARLINLLRKGNYCQQSFRETPPICEGGQPVLGIYHQQDPTSDPELRPSSQIRDWLSQLLDKGPMRLVFASRDSRLPEGDGGRYYLVFQAANPGPKSADFNYDQLGVIVTPGENEPIETFIMMVSADTNPLQWIQVLGGDDGARHHTLITPESVVDWPGWHNR